jgi:hypothetical protein
MASRESDIIHANILNNKEEKAKKKKKEKNIPSCALQLLPDPTFAFWSIFLWILDIYIHRRLYSI